MDKLIIMWIVVANIIALGVLHHRLEHMGYKLPFAHHVDHLYEHLGLFHGAYAKCGLLNDTNYIVTSQRVVFPDGVRPAAITVKAGKITDVSDLPPKHTRYPILDYQSSVIMPGVIDVHVHFNEPGRVEWEGIETGSAAAAAGGITTAVDMPLNSDPVTITSKLALQKLELLSHKAHINMGAWGGLVPGNAANHTALWSMLSAGVLGFKSFMSPSGIDDFPNVTADDVAAAMHFLMAKGVPYFVHAELVADVETDQDADPRKFATFLATRPPSFEENAIGALLRVVLEEHIPPSKGFALHIAHLGDAGSLATLKAAKRRIPLSVETCPHYLLFSAETIADGDTRFKCMPPLRDARNREALLAGILDGTIDLVSSDHSPAPPEMKQLGTGDFLKAWGGISGVQYLLPATWTAVQGVGVGLPRLAQLLSTNPARLIGLQNNKGIIQKGFDADFTIWDPELPADTSVAANRHKHKITPYSDMKLNGRVVATFVNGHLVYSLEGGLSAEACGVGLRKHWRDTKREQPNKAWLEKLRRQQAEEL